MYTPPFIVFDVETALTDGTPSVDYFREDFRVTSAAFAWRGPEGQLRSLFCPGEEAVLKQLQLVKCPLVVHNFQFEYGVTAHRFPGYEDRITHDTMRLVQVADNGGSWAAWQPKVVTEDALIDDSEPPQSSGLGLVAAASRWLPDEWKNHKEPYHKWLRDHGAKKGQEGANLTRLPPNMLEAYNVADAKVTLLLYEALTESMAKDGYDWTLDHELYKSTARMVATAKGVGARVDREALARYAAEIEAEVAIIEQEFRKEFWEPLASLEASYMGAYVRGCASAAGVRNRQVYASEHPEEFHLNLGSNKQLKELFVDTLGITPRFWTKAPKGRRPDAAEYVPFPSFKSAHLSTYGEGGQILIKRRKRLLVLQQARALLKLSEYDGRWHWDVRAAGTATGRMSGGTT